MTSKKSIGLTSLFKDTAGYGLGQILRRSISLILFPIYTSILLPEDYGVLDIANTTIFFLAIFTYFQMGLGMTWIYFVGGKDDPEKMRDAVATTTIGVLLFGLVIVGISLLFGNQLSFALFGPGVDPDLIGLVISAGFLTTIFQHITTVIRNDRKVALFNVLTLGNFGLTLVLQIFFVVTLRLGYYGACLANWLGMLAVFIVALPWLYQQVRIGMKWPTLHFILKYSLPMIPGAIALWFLNLANRYFLKTYADMDEVGLFAVAFRITSVLMILLEAFRLAWRPVRFQIAQGEHSKEQTSRLFSYYLLFCCSCSLALSLGAKDLLRLFINPLYFDAYRVVPYLCAGFGFYYSNMINGMGLALKKKIHISMYWYVGVAVVSLGLNFLFIDTMQMGIIGAALATTIPYAIAAFGIHYSSRPYFHVHIAKRRALTTITITAALYLVGILDPFANNWLNMGYRIVICLGYLPLLFVLKAFSLDELRMLKEKVMGGLGRSS